MDDSKKKPVLPTAESHNWKTISEQYGVWEVLTIAEGHRERYQRFFHETARSLPSFYRLLQDIYSLSPTLFSFFVLCQLWAGCQEAVKMHFTSQVLRMIERCLREGVPEYAAIIYLLLQRLIVTAFAEFLSWCNEDILKRLHRQITSHFEMRILKAQLRHDLTQVKDPTKQSRVTASQAWDSFQGLLQFSSLVMTVISQFVLVFHLSRRDSGGPLFALICMLRPIIATLMSKHDVWNRACLVRDNNKDHRRMEALVALAKPEYREDVISNNLRDFIIQEYQNANKRLGDLSIKPVYTLLSLHEKPYLPTLLGLIGDFPIVYCALLTLTKPQTTSFSSIAILQEISALLVHYVNLILNGTERFKRNLREIHDIYQFEVSFDSKPVVQERTICIKDRKVGAARGIQFNLRNVSFTYPGSQTRKGALRNINLTIKSGQFVVLVGSNGSGKSTLVKLLLRLYKPSNEITYNSNATLHNDDGEILMDGEPASSYSETSLRQSMAVLSQDIIIYPGFSLAENIGLGFSPLVSDDKVIQDAAKKAGAETVLERMKEGGDTVLDPLSEFWEFNIKQQDDQHPLKKALAELRKPVQVSGGEKQRIVAARTFMKFNSGDIRFLAVDEPSSALDAEAEELLLDNLLKEREGKTIVFVTHKFGKLTKQADLIVCLKEGEVVESGTHTELMKNDGEYKKLYNIQANAFQDDGVAAT